MVLLLLVLLLLLLQTALGEEGEIRTGFKEAQREGKKCRNIKTRQKMKMESRDEFTEVRLKQD